MINININEESYAIAQMWEECTMPQAISLALVAIAPAQKVARPEREYAFMILSGISPKLWATLELNPTQHSELLKLTDFVWASKPVRLSSDHLTLWPRFAPSFIKKSGLGGKKYYLPDPELMNIAALDLAWLMVSLVKIGQSKTEEESTLALNELIGIAARPVMKPASLLQARNNPHWNGDRRQPVSQHGTAANSKALAALPYAQKCLVLLYVTGIIENFRNEFSILFEADASDTVQPNYPEGFGLEAHLRRVAKDGRFGDYEKVCQTPARTVWLNEVQLLLEHEAELANLQRQNEKNQ